MTSLPTTYPVSGPSKTPTSPPSVLSSTQLSLIPFLSRSPLTTTSISSYPYSPKPTTPSIPTQLPSKSSAISKVQHVEDDLIATLSVGIVQTAKTYVSNSTLRLATLLSANVIQRAVNLFSDASSAQHSSQLEKHS
mmetsp:Transcript_13782/g.18652  ORF Transcript_13782/g.18652 Transcript_13782/m.18652 type:complete len:136 (-) Transcript_13782:957-1364(-)